MIRFPVTRIQCFGQNLFVCYPDFHSTGRLKFIFFTITFVISDTPFEYIHHFSSYLFRKCLYNIFLFFIQVKCGTIALVWVLSLTLTVLFSVLSIFTEEPELGSYIRGVVFACSAILVFITYVYIAHLLFEQRRKNKLSFSNDNQDCRLKRLTVLCLFIGISFVACVLPITIGYLNPALYHHSSNMLITLNALVNPCIYFMKVFYEARSRKRTNR